MLTEITVKIKDEDKTYNQKFLVYDKIVTLSHDDETLKGVVNEACSNIKSEPDEITIRTLYYW